MRSRNDYGEAIETVGAVKQRRVRRAAEVWLASRPELAELEISFEVIGIADGRVERMRDAF